ncbi:unnamed protein product [Psylliodes chrysocephalus]|uniref:endo-polygalacturonase n=1 Tax=Psylliodes chrysocephalus TaxID=3402493 RepID=A0A9P0D850_9CUCU|nr:unnamed protein product [Psylliodes chrysocephala]
MLGKILIFTFFTSLVTSQQNECVITEFSQVETVVTHCTNIIITNLTVPAGEALILDLQDGSRVLFEGNIIFEVAYWLGHLVQVTGNNVLVEGAPGSILNAQGEKYWDGMGGNGGVTKPKFFNIATSGGSVFRNIYLLNCAHFCVRVAANDTHLYGWTLDVNAGNLNGGLNTDGFGISHANNVIIEDSVVMNQDDCVAVTSGNNLTFRNLQCYGSHGLSFSMGSSSMDNDNGITKNVTFRDCLVANGLYGIHLKTKRGRGLVTDVTYENIKLSGITEDGIYINQDYMDIGNIRRPFKIKNLKISNVYGSINGNLARPVHIVCNEDTCSDWNWSDINIIGTGRSYCNYLPLGFSC